MASPLEIAVGVHAAQQAVYRISAMYAGMIPQNVYTAVVAAVVDAVDAERNSATPVPAAS